jgi:hypothetical protein
VYLHNTGVRFERNDGACDHVWVGSEARQDFYSDSHIRSLSFPSRREASTTPLAVALFSSVAYNLTPVKQSLLAYVVAGKWWQKKSFDK